MGPALRWAHVYIGGVSVNTSTGPTFGGKGTGGRRAVRKEEVTNPAPLPRPTGEQEGGARASAVSLVSHATGRIMLERGACEGARGCRHGNRKLLYTRSMTNGAMAAIRSSLF
jgi:hypothetical protein